MSLAVAMLFLLAFAANAFNIWRITDSGYSADAESYLAMARAVRNHGDFQGATFRTPVYPLFLAPFLAADGQVNPRRVAFVQTLLLVLLVAGAWHFGRRILGLSPAVSALIAALLGSQFQLLANAQIAGTEIVATFFLAVVVFCVAAFICQPSLWPALTGGFFCGLLALTRPQYYFLAPFLALGLAIVRVNWRFVLLFLLAAVLLQGSWLVRTSRQLGLFLPADSVVFGLREHVAKELYAYLNPRDFGFTAEQAEKLTGPDLEARLRVLTEAIDDRYPVREQILRYRAMVAAGLKNGGLPAFLRQVGLGMTRLLGARTGYWESRTVIGAGRHSPFYLRLAKAAQEAIDRWHPWLFCLAGVLLIPLLLGPRSPSSARLILAFAWLTIGFNVLICAVSDIPINARFALTMTPFYPFFYLGYGKLLWALMPASWRGYLSKPVSLPGK